MIVGMNFARTARTAQQFTGAVGDYFIGIHISRRAGAGLENIEDEVTVELTIDHFLSRLYNRRGNRRINGSQGCIYLGGSQFDLTKSSNKLAWKAEITNGKINHDAFLPATVIAMSRPLHFTP